MSSACWLTSLNRECQNWSCGWRNWQPDRESWTAECCVCVHTCVLRGHKVKWNQWKAKLRESKTHIALSQACLPFLHFPWTTRLLQFLKKGSCLRIVLGFEIFESSIHHCFITGMLSKPKVIFSCPSSGMCGGQCSYTLNCANTMAWSMMCLLNPQLKKKITVPYFSGESLHSQRRWDESCDGIFIVLGMWRAIIQIEIRVCWFVMNGCFQTGIYWLQGYV